MPVKQRLAELLQQAWNAIAPGEGLLQDLTPCSGGSINAVYLVKSQSGKMIVKVNSASEYPDMFLLEAEGLHALTVEKGPRIPKVYGNTVVEDHQFLFMEYMSPSEKSAGFDSQLGESLSVMHRHTAVEFGWGKSNYMGSLVQLNGAEKDSASFFWNQRLAPQIALARNRYGDQIKLALFDKLHDVLHRLLPDEQPALIHGDLWAGNCLTHQGLAVLIDPAVSYGPREMDLSMMRLFGGFAPKVLEAYNSAFPLTPGFEQRVDLWNLYPLLVHLNLFGLSYWIDIQSILKRYN